MNQQLSAVLIRRRNLFAAAIILSLGVVGLRFFQLQIFHHDQYVTYAENNSIRDVRLPAPRGMMFDRNGNFLVTNRPQYSLSVIPAEVRRSLTELGELDRYLEITQEDIHQIIEEADGLYERFQPVFPL